VLLIGSEDAIASIVDNMMVDIPINSETKDKTNTDDDISKVCLNHDQYV
jgi:hypothetical protein